MEILTKITNEGVLIGIGNESLEFLKPSPLANQEKPKDFYVYAHYDEHNVPFYIGKGKGKRAWDSSRHELWHRYVQNHLKGKYKVVILIDDLSADEAERIENLWIAQESKTLVNWINYNRDFDSEAINKYHKLRNANRELIAKARAQEKINIDEAIHLYYIALNNIEFYASIQSERDLVGVLLAERQKEQGFDGEIQVLDRLTICLSRTGRDNEAIEVAKQYFIKFRADLSCSATDRINKRIDKMIKKMANKSL